MCREEHEGLVVTFLDMDNAWQAKCTPALASSSSSVASSVQVPSQISKNQIGTNVGHCLQLCDVRQSRFQASAMTQVSSFSSIPDLSPCSGHLDTRNSFLSLLSATPQVQSDFPHSSNVRVLSSSCPVSFSSAALNSSSISISNQHLRHDPREYNRGSGGDVCPLFPSRVLGSSQRSGGPVSHEGQDTVKPSVAHAGSVHIDARYVNFTQKGYMGSSIASSDRMPRGLNLCTSKKSPPGLSSFHHDLPSTFMSSSRVFCMNKSGDLLVSNAGLLAVVCSCHGSYMSISNFSEHSGISNVIPGYAVRMDTGETLAQWRKIYFSKLGIRVPEDNKGWEWPKEHLSTVGNPRSSASSIGGIKRSVLSDMVCTSVEPEYTRRFYDNISAGYPYVSQNQMGGVSQNDQPGNSYHQHNIFSAGLSVIPESSLRNTVNDCVKACPSPNGYTRLKSVCQGGLCDGGQLSSKSCNIVSQSGNSFSQCVGGLLDKAQTNKNISALSVRGATSSSSIELKLGQPSEKCRSLESPVPAISSQFYYNDPLKITFQQEIDYKTSPPWETDCQQYAQFGTGLSSSSRKEKQLDLSKHSYVATNMIANIETVNNDLSRHSRLSVRPTYLATSSGGMSFEETTKLPNDSHHFIPGTRHFQHHTVKSGQINIADETARPSNTDGTVKPSDRSACVSSTNKNLVTGNTNIGSLASSETHFRLYANQMEKMGFFNRDTRANNQHSPVDGKNQLLSMVPNILDTSKLPEETGEINCRGSAHLKFISSRKIGSSMGFRPTFPTEEFLQAMPSATPDLAQHLKSVLPNKKEACFGPSKINESLRKISLVEQAKRGEMNAFHLSSRHRKLQSAGPDLKMGGSLLNLLPSEEQIGRSNITYKSSLSELTSTSFSPVLSHQYNNNVEASSSTSDNPGANLKKLTTHRNGLSSYDGETSKHCHGCHDPPAELLLQGADNQTALHGTCKICSHRGYNTRKCSCISNILSSNKESEIGETSSTRGLKKHSPSNEAISMCASGINLGCVPAKKSILLEENGMVKGLVHEELKSSISQLRDVPAKIKGDCKVMCTNEPVHGIGRRGVSGAEFKDFSAENDPRSSKIDESLKGKELSNLSSECSGSTIKQVSLEVNTAGSSRVDTEDPVCESDQVADQGSTVDKCFLPYDATVSQTSSDHLSSSGKVQSTRSHFSNSLYNLDSHDCINEHKERDILGKRKVESHGLICVKRKRRTKWTTLDTSTVPSGVALSSYESPSDRGDPASLQYHLAKWRNCALSPLQRCSRKRYLDMAYDNGTTEHNSETDLKNKPDCDNLPDIVAVKKLKHDNSNEATDKVRLQKVDLNNDGAVMKSNSVGLAEADYSTQGYLQGSKMKPLVCGMYGIISGRENILRLPKIFSLSQVLKTARKCEVEPQLTSVKESKKRSLDGRFCSFGEGRDSRCKKFRQPSRSSGISLRGNDKTSSDAGWSAENKQGLDKTKTNASMSSIVTSAQFKPKFKAVRRRSLYELFMEGERFSSKHKEDSYNTSTLPEQCTYDMKTNKKLDQLSGDNSDWSMGIKGLPLFLYDSPCCVCGKSNEDQTNCLLECGRCSIRIHQACYGITRLPKSQWYCRPCSTNSVDIVCVLCGYGSGAMTQALKCHNVVKSLLKAWNVPIESGTKRKLACSEAFHVDMEFSRISTRSMVHNSVTTGLFDPTVKQWIHMVCGLWTPGTRCPNVDTMSSFDVSGVPQSKANTVCVICKRRGGSCIRCRVPHCSSWFHPWCAHLKDLLRSEPEGVSNEKIGFYGRCMLHAMSLPGQNEPDLDTFKLKGRKDATCARTEGYKGRKQDGKRYNASCRSKGKGRCLVPPEQLNAWLHINRQKLSLKPSLNSSISDVEHHYKKEYVRYKQTKGWKQLIVYKSGIHALGLYTSQLIPRGAMVVEYVGEIVGLRVADKRENEYQSGRKLQYKSACYFFRIDKEHIVDATRKGGIARFVNHSCMPNCVAKIISMRNEKKVVFFAQRDIYPGEEITYDYHFNNEDEGKKIPCFCNSRNCRRYLN